MNITFEPLNELHFSLLLKWLEMPYVKKWWDPDVTYTMGLVKKKYGERAQQRAQVKAYIICASSKPAGYIQLYDLHNFPRSAPLTGIPQNSCGLDLFIGESELLRSGLAAQSIIKCLDEHARGYLYAFADPDINNIAAIKTYEKAGLKKTGDPQDLHIQMLGRLKRVRLSEHDLDALIASFQKHFLSSDQLWLFGSRANLAKKGGDIDLYIETYVDAADDVLQRKGNFIWDLEQKIGEQKIDVVLNRINVPYPLPIHEIAKTEGIRIV